MKVVITPDSFKGCLSAKRAALAIEKGIKSAFYDDVHLECFRIPMADGGEGTVEAIIEAVGGDIIVEEALNPLGKSTTSFYGVLPDNTAVIEMAAASGLNLIDSSERNPLRTTTYGTGQLILSALKRGCKRFIIGIGGSATNDCGAGMAQALGAKLLDYDGHEIGFGGGELDKVAKIDVTSLYPEIHSVRFTIASDVKNPLCGPDGASNVYGPQKGATAEMVKILDNNLRHFAGVIKKETGKDILNVPGSGASGGLGAGLIAFLEADIQSGIDIVMDLADLEKKIQDADWIITGEGATDFQSMFGKVPFGIGQLAKKWGKPVLCISGTLGSGCEQLYDIGITGLFSIVNKPMTLQEAITGGEKLLTQETENIFRLIKASLTIGA
ncbi:MAG TPA: glycerate kinase [Firmicutes bacterium]|jgi:glycerate 2-kinase|nr:glycerate kinase [Bacillota bacterium]